MLQVHISVNLIHNYNFHPHVPMAKQHFDELYVHKVKIILECHGAKKSTRLLKHCTAPVDQTL